MESLFSKLVGAQWTGESSADVLTALAEVNRVTGNTWTVDANDGNTLVLRETAPNGLSATWTMRRNQVIIIDAARSSITIMDAAEFGNRFVRFDDMATAVLTFGINSAQFVAALRTKLGLSVAKK